MCSASRWRWARVTAFPCSPSMRLSALLIIAASIRLAVTTWRCRHVCQLWSAVCTASCAGVATARCGCSMRALSASPMHCPPIAPPSPHSHSAVNCSQPPPPVHVDTRRCAYSMRAHCAPSPLPSLRIPLLLSLHCAFTLSSGATVTPCSGQVTHTSQRRTAHCSRGRNV